MCESPLAFTEFHRADGGMTWNERDAIKEHGPYCSSEDATVQEKAGHSERFADGNGLGQHMHGLASENAHHHTHQPSPAWDDVQGHAPPERKAAGEDAQERGMPRNGYFHEAFLVPREEEGEAEERQPGRDEEMVARDMENQDEQQVALEQEALHHAMQQQLEQEQLEQHHLQPNEGPEIHILDAHVGQLDMGNLQGNEDEEMDGNGTDSGDSNDDESQASSHIGAALNDGHEGVQPDAFVPHQVVQAEHRFNHVDLDDLANMHIDEVDGELEVLEVENAALQGDINDLLESLAASHNERRALTAQYTGVVQQNTMLIQQNTMLVRQNSRIIQSAAEVRSLLVVLRGGDPLQAAAAMQRVLGALMAIESASDPQAPDHSGHEVDDHIAYFNCIAIRLDFRPSAANESSNETGHPSEECMRYLTSIAKQLQDQVPGARASLQFGNLQAKDADIQTGHDLEWELVAGKLEVQKVTQHGNKIRIIGFDLAGGGIAPAAVFLRIAGKLHSRLPALVAEGGDGEPSVLECELPAACMGAVEWTLEVARFGFEGIVCLSGFHTARQRAPAFNALKVVGQDLVLITGANLLQTESDSASEEGGKDMTTADIFLQQGQSQRQRLEVLRRKQGDPQGLDRLLVSTQGVVDPSGAPELLFTCSHGPLSGSSRWKMPLDALLKFRDLGNPSQPPPPPSGTGLNPNAGIGATQACKSPPETRGSHPERPEEAVRPVQLNEAMDLDKGSDHNEPINESLDLGVAVDDTADLGSMGPGDLLTIIIIGVVGSGKSSLATRLIGQDVFSDEDQLTFPPSAGSKGNDKLIWGEGYLLGREDLGRVRVGDFPGFNHIRGPDFDIATMAEIGRVLESETVHAVVFVFDANPRLTTTVLDLFDAILYKLDPSDYDKIYFVHNRYTLSEDTARQRRLDLGRTLGREATDGDVKRQMVSELLNLYMDRSEAGDLLPLDDRVHDLFARATSFLNTNFRPDTTAGNREKEELQKFAAKLKSTTKPINRELAAENQTRDMHQGYKEAQDRVKRREGEARQHMEQLEPMRAHTEELKTAGDKNTEQSEETIEAVEQALADAIKRAIEAPPTQDREAQEYDKAIMAKNNERRAREKAEQERLEQQEDTRPAKDAKASSRESTD